MKFGIREVCEMEFVKIPGSGNGPASFKIDTAKMTTLESTSSTTYAQGGRGNSRLMAWEGEKTVTFTIEDALLTMESFWALTGADYAPTASGVKFTVRPVSFAAAYSITAQTFFRDEESVDHPAIITIPRAKLQTTLNLSMAPTGDPSAFTFTFDAFPIGEGDDKMIYSLEIQDIEDENKPTADEEEVYITIEEETAAIKKPQFIAINDDNTLRIVGGDVEEFSYSYKATAEIGDYLTDLSNIVKIEGSESRFGLMGLSAGQRVTIYII